MESKTKYQVKVRYVFEGIYIIKTDTRENAIQSVIEHCGLVMGGKIHTTLNVDTVDWDFCIHPELVIRSIKELKPIKS